MLKWAIIKEMFMSNISVIEKGFLDEKTANTIAEEMNNKSDFYTFYYTQAYESNNVFDIENLNIKLKLKNESSKN